MIIKTSLKEIANSGKWDLFCEEKGFDPYCLREYQEDIEIELTETEAYKYGLLEVDCDFYNLC